MVWFLDPSSIVAVELTLWAGILHLVASRNSAGLIGVLSVLGLHVEGLVVLALHELLIVFVVAGSLVSPQEMDPE